MTGISEDADRQATSGSSPTPDDPGAGRSRARSLGRYTVTGLAGVLVGAGAASALWATGLVTYGQTPDTKGYAATSDLCADAKLKALGGALGDPTSPEGDHWEHDALDISTCFLRLESAGEEQPYNALIHYRLHKKTDPAAEFEVYATDPGYLAPEDAEFRAEPLGGLGDEAIELVADDGSGIKTSVRDGGAVLSLTVYPSHQQHSISEDSRELIKSDLADLLAALKK
ncbi:hypothetical protein [Streptomyces sp. PR69]|uniref:hypothetical protein n=1 Tax=Streptomyces sp. PR69 TaxID=2984950 RepID=UPI002264897A|nr:hypothetical protein [Streptomyces sp. PR69]